MKTTRWGSRFGGSRFVGGLVGVAFLVTAASAQASLVWQIETTFGSGDVTFPSATGNSPAGIDLSFGDFTEDHITSAQWTIDETSWELTLLAITAQRCTPTVGTQTDSCERGDHVPGDRWTREWIYLSFGRSTSALFENFCSSGSSSGCTGFFSTRARDDFLDFNLMATPVHNDIPAPASLALFVIAIGGLGFIMRRRGPVRT